MVVDIVTKREPGHKVIVKSYMGPWTGDDMLREEFTELERWAKKNGIRTSKWFRIYLDKYAVESPSDQRRWWASIAYRGRTHALPPRMEAKFLPPELVASVTFNPEVVSDRLVFHGLECWLDWRTKQGEFEEAGPTREVFVGNPWVDPVARTQIELQVPIRKLGARS